MKRFISSSLRKISYYSDFGILRPSKISISITNRCNSRCPTCSYWKNNSQDEELTTEEWKKIILDIFDWYGPFQFVLSGGEPLLRNDICEIIQYARKLDCNPSIITNGLILTSDKIHSLIKAGLKEFVISLNGASEKTHDTTRGVPGGFKKIIRAIKQLKKYKNNAEIQIGIATVLMGYNLHEVKDLVQLIREERLDRITFQALFFETGNNSYKTKWYNDSHLWAIKEKRDYDYLDGLIKLKGMTKEIANPIAQLRHFKKYFQNPDKTLDIPCMVGVHSFFIEPNGDVKLCYLFESIGNLKNNTPQQIWNSKKTIQIRKKIRNCELNCRLKNCNYNT